MSQSTTFNLKDLWGNYAYYPTTVSGIRSMNSGTHYTVLSKGHIDKYSYKEKTKPEIIVKPTDLIPDGMSKPLRIEGYEFSQDESKVLIYTAKESIYRHSFKADYWVFTLATKKLEKIGPGKQQLASFSPDAKKVAYVDNNNIYVKTLDNDDLVQVTKDGEFNKVLNGAPDWVYEEEFSFSKAWQWSPDGAYIAYLRFDESTVMQWDMKMYGELYPEMYRYKYPKSGEANSVVTVHTFNLATKKSLKVDMGDETDIYIPRIKWTPTNQLSVQKLNRLQNNLEIFLTNPADGSMEMIYHETNKYYVDITDNLHFLTDGSGFMLTSEKDGFNHIYYYNIQGKEEIQITSGEWDVMEMLGVDEKAKSIYFLSAESGAINRDLYNVDYKKLKKTKLSTIDGTYSADFSNNFQYYVGSFSDINTPPVFSVFKGGKKLYDLADNAGLKGRLADAGYSNAEFLKFKTDYDVELNAYLVKPNDFDPTKRYPVLVHTYGGPGINKVNNAWGWFDMVWFQMLAQKGILVMVVDPRGTGARGQEFKKMTYLQLGKYETEDMISAAKYLGDLPYVDSKRIGVFGWSYGGYMSTLCMTKGANYYSTGIAVAPVTNWRYYDNIYTERFMRTPQENSDGYDDNSPLSHVKKLKGDYLLIHGTADDNVHIQNAMDLVDELVKHNKQFEMQFYVNDNHGIHGNRYTRLHLYTRMTNFLLEKL